MKEYKKKFYQRDELSGILVPANFSDINDICLLTPEGNYFHFFKNRKYEQIKSKLGECIHVVGQILNYTAVPLFKISYFYNEFERISMTDDIEDLENIESNSHLAENTFIDYESIYT